eukprot:m.229748 g.229748  ORF g.229748 m.229748 type:complete len:274 (-) comp18849_c1_seq2:285-1106(-)
MPPNRPTTTTTTTTREAHGTRSHGTHRRHDHAPEQPQSTLPLDTQRSACNRPPSGSANAQPKHIIPHPAMKQRAVSPLVAVDRTPAAGTPVLSPGAWARQCHTQPGGSVEHAPSEESQHRRSVRGGEVSAFVSTSPGSPRTPRVASGLAQRRLNRHSVLPSIDHRPLSGAKPKTPASPITRVRHQTQDRAARVTVMQPSHHKKTAVTSKKKRCGQCGKRLKVTATFACRCGVSFCPQHRYAETHSCAYDYKTEGRKLLAAASPVCQVPKLPKI